jgi:hypothetical protein
MIPRPQYLERLIALKDKQIIKVITGIRRCGKSSLLTLFKEYLKNENVKDEEIISINFEDLEFESLKDYRSLYDFVNSRLTENQFYYVFLDEVQNCEHFEKAIDSLFLKKNVDLYMTGSNAYLLSGELATLLSGRYVEIEMLPLSFKEYLSSLNDKTDLERKFRDYLRFGAFPYLTNIRDNEDSINEYLDGIYHSVLIKDIITRFKIKDVMILESVIKFLFDNVGNMVSTKKISDTLTSDGRKVSPPTVENYLTALKNSFIIYQSDRYDIRGKQYLKSLEKYYVVDTGLRNCIIGYKNIDSGHVLENIVFLELYRRGYKVAVGKTLNSEIDFVATNQYDTIYIQVSQTVRDEKTLERELEPLRAINDHNPKLLLTMDNDVSTSYGGIKKVNLIDFLLGEKY